MTRRETRRTVAKWSGVEGEYIRELPRLPGFELVITFRYSGTRDEGSKYGGPDNLGSAPMIDEEWTLVEAFLTSPHCRTIPLTKEEQEHLFFACEEDVQAVELDIESAIRGS